MTSVQSQQSKILESQTAAQQRNSNITLGSSLSPTGNSNWSSDSGQFAFGFYPRGDGFAIGIWYARILPQTVVWTANRDDPPLSNDSRLLLSSDGRLILQQQQQGREEPIVAAPQFASSASMLDSGNFVLYDSSSHIIWQSFGNPTDTLLPGQVLSAKDKLISSISKANHSTGKFQLLMQTDGNLVQYPVENARVETAYWASKTVRPGDNVTLHLADNGTLYLLNSTGFNIKILNEGGSFSNNMQYRATIDADGIFRLYSHGLDQNGGWKIEWSSSENKCDPIGLCGPNEYCTSDNQEQDCACLPGFEFIDQGQRSLGCMRNFSANSCLGKNGNVTYYVRELDNIIWEDNPYSILSNTNKFNCREACLRDCNCGAALYNDGKCRKQKLPLRFGRIRLTELETTLIKVSNGSCQTTTGNRESKKEQRVGILIASVAFLTIAIIVLAISGVLIYKYRVKGYKKISNQGSDGSIEDITLQSFTYGDLEKATNGFAEEVGKGAFGTVFKGVLTNSKRVVAIKRLEVEMAQGEREFRNEMKIIGRTHHKNLVRLLGYCHDGTNRLLVYEFMSNGSLANFLFRSERKPRWEERIGIALNVARGILYLHEECETQIIHCDIKPENILMDENQCAKIADFGVSKLLMPNQTRTYTGIRGTRGYVAPEWHRNLPVTVKADVYSYGIMLLEIICCRRSVSMDVPEDEVVLANWVYDCFEASELDKLVQNEEVDMGKLERMVRVGLWCIQDEPSLRPWMKKVVLMLEGTVHIPSPPSPTSFLSLN
ncbi:hypothetical protein F0562_027543 [Nyssa sinensis]|uniref:Receptor-like serine/threonine-protein kinase n=1 Tax=Nyssa sinensis TaxID=561372 RepID=A0A5J5B7Z0_9ASTE|nr:hypothetical protein F0562_027543 [Nyssa sinensis]